MPNVFSPTLPAAYREWVPPGRLSQAVTCVWTRGTLAQAVEAPRMIVPDNSVDIIWTFDREGQLHDAAVVGPMTQPLAVHDDSDIQYVGVRFKPGYAAAITRQDVGELRDARVDLHELLPGAQHWLDGPGGLHLGSLGDRLHHTLGGLVSRAAPPPAALQHALDLVHHSRGALPIESLAKSVGVSRQHLARLFEAHIGLRPKLVARVLRLQHVMALAERTARVAAARSSGRALLSWSALASEAGYADQPHMIADFVSLTGETPAQWLAGRGQIPFFQDAHRWPT